MTRGGKGRRARAVAAIAVLAMTAAACGGGGGKKAAPAGLDATTTTAPTATSAPGEQPATAESTSTTVATPGTVKSSTASTAAKAKSTATTAKKTTATTSSVAKAVTGGIANVVATSSTAPNKAIQPGGTITFLKTAEIIGFDPVILNNSGASDGPAASAIYDLLVYNDPATGKVVGQTAESLTSTDALVWTLTLRPNIKFTDGTPYDAAAVKFNWLRLQDPNNKASRAAQANLMQSMDVVDSRTLKITLKAKNAVFPQNLTLIPFIASPKAIQEKGANLTADPTNAGAGPFMMKSWVRNGQMIVVRNPNYWNAPRPYVDQVIFQPILDEQQRINTFMAGQANMVFTGDAGSANTLTKNGAVGHPAALNGGTNIYFNTRKPPFNDLRVRQAFAMAIDRADFAKVVGAGLIDPIHSVFRPDSPFYDPNILQLAYDPVKAQQLFDAAAADLGGTISFTIYTFTASNYVAAAEYMQAVLNKFKNVKVQIDPASSPVQQTRVISGDYNVAAFGNPFDDPEPGWTSIYTCAANPSFTGWCDQGFDSLVADQRVTLDPNQRIKDIKDAQKIFYQAVPSLYYTRSSTYLFTPTNVQDFAWANDGLPLLNQMWIKTHD